MMWAPPLQEGACPPALPLRQAQPSPRRPPSRAQQRRGEEAAETPQGSPCLRKSKLLYCLSLVSVKVAKSIL